MILCSECYDELGIEHFTDIQCQATCERCKRICLGYVWKVAADELSKSTDSQKGTSDDNSGGVYANGLD